MGDAKKIGKRLNRIHRPKLDWITLILSLGFMYFGGQFWSFFYMGEYWNYRTYYSSWSNYYKLVCIELVLGVLFGIFLFFYDYRKICGDEFKPNFEEIEQAKKDAYQQQKRDFLYSEGIYEIEYSKDGKESEEYQEYDYDQTTGEFKFYKYVFPEIGSVLLKVIN